MEFLGTKSINRRSRVLDDLLIVQYDGFGDELDGCFRRSDRFNHKYECFIHESNECVNNPLFSEDFFRFIKKEFTSFT